jgi:hypothetical protein
MFNDCDEHLNQKYIAEIVLNDIRKGKKSREEIIDMLSNRYCFFPGEYDLEDDYPRPQPRYYFASSEETTKKLWELAIKKERDYQKWRRLPQEEREKTHFYTEEEDIETSKLERKAAEADLALIEKENPRCEIREVTYEDHGNSAFLEDGSFFRRIKHIMFSNH